MSHSAQEPPIHVVAADAAWSGSRTSDRDALFRLTECLAASAFETDIDGVLRRLVELVTSLVEVDAVVIHLGATGSSHVPDVLVHWGLRDEEVAAYLESPASAIVPSPDTGRASRLAHRLSCAITGAGARPGELVMWRDSQPFGAADEERAGAAAQAIPVLAHQFLRRIQLEQQEQWQNAASQINDALLTGTGGPAVVRLVVDLVREISSCDVAWLATHMRPGEPLLKVLSTSEEGARLATPSEGLVDLGATLTGQVMATGQPAEVSNVIDDHRTGDGSFLQQWSYLGPAVVVPVLTDGQPVGALGMAWRADRAAAFLALDRTLPARFAEWVAVTIRVGMARADAQRLAVLEERDRIRLDLHDRAVQRLYALGMALESARMRQKDPSLDEMVGGLVQHVDETIAEVRRTISGLGVVDDNMDLYDEIVKVLDAATASASFQPELRVYGLSQGAVGVEPAGHLLAVLEESLSNVTRHAQASRCRVTLKVDERLTLVVDDDGVGVPATVSGSGLANLRRRAEASNGELKVLNRSPGTRLIWSVPAAAPVAEG